MPARSPRPADLLVAGASGGVALALAIGCAQDALFGDGRALLALVEGGEWRYRHPAFLPAVHLVRALAAPVRELSAEAAVRVACALATAAGAAGTYLAARRFALPRAASAAGALLVLLAPAVLFFATTVEVHALTLVPAAAGAWWAAGAWRRGELGADALPPALVACGAGAAHVTGWIWLPAALALLAVAAAQRRRAPRRLVLAGLVVVACGAVALLVDPSPRALAVLATRGSRRWTAERTLGELVLPLGLLGLLALVPLLARLRRPRPGPSDPAWRLVVPALVLAAGYAAALGSLLLRERGGYALALAPPLAVAAAAGLARAGRWAPALAPAAVAAQAVLGLADLRSYARDHAAAAWLPALVDRVGARGVVLVRERAEKDLLHDHSRLVVLAPRLGATTFDLADERTWNACARAVDLVRASGAGCAVLRTLAEDPAAEPLLARLAARYGPLVESGRSEFLLFPPPPASTPATSIAATAEAALE